MVTLVELTVIRASIERCFDLARSIEVHLAGNIHWGEAAVASAGVTTGLLETGHAASKSTPGRSGGYGSPAGRGRSAANVVCDVVGVCFDKKVDVLRKAGLSVKDNRIPPNNEIFNAMGMEGGQKVFVVLVQWALLLR